MDSSGILKPKIGRNNVSWIWKNGCGRSGLWPLKSSELSISRTNCLYSQGIAPARMLPPVGIQRRANRLPALNLRRIDGLRFPVGFVASMSRDLSVGKRRRTRAPLRKSESFVRGGPSARRARPHRFEAPVFSPVSGRCRRPCGRRFFRKPGHRQCGTRHLCTSYRLN